jgi:chemotaxis protein MotB
MGKYGNGIEKQGLDLPTSPAWMVTYGDIMSLLLTFFVLLISYSTIRQEEFRRALSSFQEALGILPHERSVIQFEEIPAIRTTPAISPKEIVQRLRKSIRAAGFSGGIHITEEQGGVRVTVESPILFDSGKADLRAEALPLLDEISHVLAEGDQEVVVEGHTDNVPIHTEEFPSNWELSTARAISVSRSLFEKANLDPKRFSVAGYGEYHPIASNETDEGKQKNRRVEILLKFPGQGQKE